MRMTYDYHMRFAGIHIRILAPRALSFPEPFRPFLPDDAPPDAPDWVIEVWFGSGRMSLSVGDHVKRFPRSNGEEFLRVEPADREKTCRLFVPESMADSFCRYGNWALFLMPERLLSPYGRVILHASAVVDRGEAILFTAPSGGGKSTQASIWERFCGAEILNGDKVMIDCMAKPPVGYGSPVAGSSGIYKDLSAPIKAIVYLHKSTDRENHLQQMDERRAYMALYSQVVKSYRDEAFNRSLLPLIAEIVEKVPVLAFTCKPDETAAECLQSWLASHQASMPI